LHHVAGRDRKAEHAPCANCYGVSESEAFPVFTVLFDACIVTFCIVDRCPQSGPFGITAVTVLPAVGKLVTHARSGCQGRGDAGAARAVSCHRRRVPPARGS